jgi:hypothetical protein
MIACPTDRKQNIPKLTLPVTLQRNNRNETLKLIRFINHRDKLI